MFDLFKFAIFIILYTVKKNVLLKTTFRSHKLYTSLTERIKTKYTSVLNRIDTVIFNYLLKMI